MQQMQLNWLNGEMSRHLQIIAAIHNNSGYIAFACNGLSFTMFDGDDVFHPDKFILDGKTFEYNKLYNYKVIPEMLEYLKKQNLQLPNFVM